MFYILAQKTHIVIKKIKNKTKKLFRPLKMGAFKNRAKSFLSLFKKIVLIIVFRVPRYVFKKLFRLKVFKILFFIFASCMFAAFMVFIYIAKDLPPIDSIDLHASGSTKIYDRSGTIVLYDIYDLKKRTPAKLEEIPIFMQKATIAAEDSSFYSHHGVDFKGLARAAYVNVVERRVSQGGSTITQQLIKNILFTPEKGSAPRTVGRKAKEIILTIELERRYSKDEVLEAYLNQITYGSSAYGVATAAQTYFQKDIEDITLGEAALLASLPKAPSYYISEPEELEKRRRNVLFKMERLEYITREERVEAEKEKITLSQKYDRIKAPHFVLEVKRQLEERYGREEVERGGLRVITTIDMDVQRLAEDAVAKWAERNENQYKSRNSALVVVDPNTGEIIAMVGSRDYFDEENDGNVNVAMRPRQPGSSFKPFAYAAAFRKGYTANTVVYDVPTEFNPSCSWESIEDKGSNGAKCYHPNNYDERFFGAMSLKEALAQSRNIPAVKMLYLAGLNETISLAQDMGITTLTDTDRYGLSLVLGGGEVTLLEETAAYGVFATGGILYKPLFILEAQDSQGHTETFFSKGKHVLEKNITDQITTILSSEEYRSPTIGTRSALYIDGLAVAAKTGTTQEFRDAWIIGYTPSISVGVWSGNNDNTPMRSGAFGSLVSSPIWNNFLQSVYELKREDSEIKKGMPRYFSLPNKEDEKFDLSDIPETGKDILDGIINEKSPRAILRFVKKDNPLGEKPEIPELEDALYENWEKTVRYWSGLKYDSDEPLTPDSEIIKFLGVKTLYYAGDVVLFNFVIGSPYEIKTVLVYLDDKKINEYKDFDGFGAVISSSIKNLTEKEGYSFSVEVRAKNGRVFRTQTYFSIKRKQATILERETRENKDIELTERLIRDFDLNIIP